MSWWERTKRRGSPDRDQPHPSATEGPSFEDALAAYQQDNPGRTVVCSADGQPVICRYDRVTQNVTLIADNTITVCPPKPTGKMDWDGIFDVVGSLPEAQTHQLAIAVLPGYTGGDPDTELYIVVTAGARQARPVMGEDWAPIY